jgi:hypothetical protein
MGCQSSRAGIQTKPLDRLCSIAGLTNSWHIGELQLQPVLLSEPLCLSSKQNPLFTA